MVKKWTACVEKISDAEYRAYCPTYGNIIITSTSLETAVSDLKKKVISYLSKYPVRQKEFADIESVKLKQK